MLLFSLSKIDLKLQFTDDSMIPNQINILKANHASKGMSSSMQARAFFVVGLPVRLIIGPIHPLIQSSHSPESVHTKVGHG